MYLNWEISYLNLFFIVAAYNVIGISQNFPYYYFKVPCFLLTTR